MSSSLVVAVLALSHWANAQPPARHSTGPSKCRVLPGDPQWPAPQAWAALNSSIGGRLIATVPLARQCHAPYYDAAACQSLKAQWDYPWIHSQDPSSIDQPWFQNGTCDPYQPASVPCTLGNLVSYSVNVSSAGDVQAAVIFAQKNNVRLAIKNTGHDFIGKNTAKGGLGLWTHWLNKTEVLYNYTSPGYQGAAIKIGAGTQAYQAYTAAHDAGYRVLGGSCPTVGLAGGFTQGGGHSLLSSKYGMAADNVLEWEVVTADGKCLTATPTKNADLYWAISGGGGGTFAVVISMTTKLHKDGLVSGATLSFDISAPSAGHNFWDAVTVFHGGLEPMVNSGVVGLFQVTNSFFYSVFSAPDVPADKLKQLLAYTTSFLDAHNVKYTLSVTEDPTYLDHFKRYFGPLPGGVWETTHLVSSRLFPQKVVRENNAGVVAAYKNITSDPNWIAAGLAINASHAVAKNSPGSNAVLPAWRNALVHTLFYSPWDWNATRSEMKAREDHLTYNIAPLVESITPDSGTYLNEANFDQIEWQKQFYGSNYKQLLAVKNKYDPKSLLYAKTAVGSEEWREDSVGRLCRA